MKLKRLIASVAAFSLGLAGCVSAARVGDGPPPGAVPGPALWKVADADTTIYLFGTVHALPQDKDWFDPRIERAFAESDELVTEIDVSSAASSAQVLASAAMLPPGRTLREMMTDENRRQFEEALVGLGLAVDSLDRVEPWMAALTLTMLPLVRAGYQQESGVELALSSRAGTKKRGALETIEQQVEVFDGMPLEAQLAFLDRTVEVVPEASTSLDAMVAEWIEGDADELAKLMNEELTDPVLKDRLLIARNANWAEWIERRMAEPGKVFVAVGAGHLAGQGSVQDQLAKRGIKVERVWR